MRKLIAGVVGCAAAVALAAPATAHNNVFESQLIQDDVGCCAEFRAIGFVESQRAACVPDRKVKLFFHESGVKTLIDTDRTSDNGAWVLRGAVPEPLPDSYTLKVPKERLESPSGHRHVCGADAFSDEFIDIIP